MKMIILNAIFAHIFKLLSNYLFVEERYVFKSLKSKIIGWPDPLTVECDPNNLKEGRYLAKRLSEIQGRNFCLGLK